MRRPGNRLLAFAARWCCADTMTRIVHPLIADLQHEHARAVQEGRVWRSGAIHVAGWVAFLKVIVICAWAEMTDAERWTLDDRKSLMRAAVISALTAVFITVLLVSRSAENYPSVLLHPSPKRFLYLAPYPFVAGIVLGGALGIVLGLGGRPLSRRLAGIALGAGLMCSAMAFVDLGWVAPASNIAYRVTLGDTNPTPGPGEQSLGELRRQMEQFSGDARFAHFGFPLALSFDFHRRVALSFSPLVFTLFALTMAGCLRRRWVLGIAACVAFVGYGWLFMVVRPWGINWPVFATAWLPNAAILCASAALLGLLKSRKLKA
jgi:Lipopolysaccharide export system permease LptF/LptG